MFSIQLHKNILQSGEPEPGMMQACRSSDGSRSGIAPRNTAVPVDFRPCSDPTPTSQHLCPIEAATLLSPAFSTKAHLISRLVSL